MQVNAPIPTSYLSGVLFVLFPTADPNPANHYVNLKYALCYINGAIIPLRQNLNSFMETVTLIPQLTLHVMRVQLPQHCHVPVDLHSAQLFR